MTIILRQGSVQCCQWKDTFFLPHKFKLNIALFEGTNQYGRYSHLLLDIIDEYEVELKSMGFNTRDLVTQGFRKGVSIMVSDGFAGPCHIALICIRCGWYMVMVKDIYLKYEVAEYQYIG